MLALFLIELAISNNDWVSVCPPLIKISLLNTAESMGGTSGNVVEQETTSTRGFLFRQPGLLVK